MHGDGHRSVRKTLDNNDIGALVVIGGDRTLQTALKLADDGVRVIGMPETIDDDIAATDVTFGFDTAVQIASEAIDRLTTTAEAHNRSSKDVLWVKSLQCGWQELSSAVVPRQAARSLVIHLPQHQAMGWGGAASGVAVPCFQDPGYLRGLHPASSHFDAESDHRANHLVTERLRLDLEDEQCSSAGPLRPSDGPLGASAFLGATQ